MKNTLAPIKIIESEGNLSYNESNQAWGTLRLKSELINEFRQLKEKRSKFNYRLLFYRDYEDFEKIVKQIIKDKKVIPMLVWLEKESIESN
ncbi:MAG: hypothetical protein Q8N63_07205 [Nanoarchaeota archaeon]|nr:hypothetical protein [Nanoarchaeota archaeon]